MLADARIIRLAAAAAADAGTAARQNCCPNGIPGLWLLVPGDRQAVMDGKAVPILSPGQRSRIPRSWLQNRYRAGAVPLG